MVRGEISRPSHRATAYGGARRARRNTNTNPIQWWDGTPWMVCNILQQAMLNIMPVTATDAG